MLFLTDKYLYIYVSLFFSYLYINTGIHSDDWIIINQIQGYSFKDIMIPDLGRIHVIVFGIPSYYLDYLQYYFFQYNYIAYDFVKIIFSTCSFILIYKFFIQYINRSNSILTSLFIILYITHDGINYWTIAQPYLLVFPIIMYSHMLINNEKYYGFTIHKVSPELDDGQIISNKTKKINTKNESELMKKHKSLEHQFVYKQLVNYLLN